MGLLPHHFFPPSTCFFWLICRVSVILTTKMTKKAWNFDNVYTYHKDIKETTWYWPMYLNTANTDLLFCYILIDLGWPWPWKLDVSKFSLITFENFQGQKYVRWRSLDWNKIVAKSLPMYSSLPDGVAPPHFLPPSVTFLPVFARKSLFLLRAFCRFNL